MYTQRIKRHELIIESAFEPDNKHVIWLDVSSKNPVFKIFNGISWEPISSPDLSEYIKKTGGTFTGDVNIGDEDGANLSVHGNIYVENGEIHMSEEPEDDMSAINRGYVDVGLSKCVQVKNQSFSDTEKNQARVNIGALSSKDPSTITDPTNGYYTKSESDAILAGKQDSITSVNVSVSNTTGRPSGSASVAGNTLNLSFLNIKGEKGEQGNSGYTGAAGELEVVNNLTDGGATKALSAEMGKTLDEENNRLEQRINGIQWTNGYLINKTTLQPSANVNYRYSNAVYVNSGTVITIKSGGTDVALIIRTNDSGVFQESLLSSNNTTDYSYTVLEDGYLAFCYKYAESGAKITVVGLDVDTFNSFEIKENSIKANSEDIKALNELLYAIPNTNWIENYYISVETPPRISSLSNYRVSTVISLKAGDRIEINSAGSSIAFLASCQSDGSLIDYILYSDSHASATTNVLRSYMAESDIYVRMCYKYTIEGAYCRVIRSGGELWGSIERMNNIYSCAIPNPEWTNRIVSESSLAIQTNESYKLSRVLPVSAGDVFYINSGGTGVSYISSCQSDGTLTASLLQSYPNASSNTNSFYSYVVESDGYVRVCYKFTLDGSFVYYAPKDTVQSFLFKELNEINNAIKDNLHLRILVFGNSYAADSWMYVPFILKNYGITCDITMYYRGALSLENLYNRWESDAEQDTETGLNAGTYNRYRYHIDTRTQNAWEDITRLSAKDCVELGGWDIISLQQWSGYSIDSATYEPYTNDILALIRDSLITPYTLAWNGVCTRPEYDNIEDSLSAHEAIYKREPIGIYLPYGTAIFNARTNQTLAALGSYEDHNLWCDDGVHIQEGIPKYIASLAIVQALFNKYFPNLSVLGDTLRPTDQLVSAWGNLEVRGSCTGVSDQNCYLAQKSAIQAVKFPFEVTTIY